MAMMESEIDLLQVEKRIRNRVKKQMEKSQREYYLNEQMKAIQKELGEMDDAPDENEALKRKIDAAKMPKEAKEKAEAELQKLKMMSPMSAEATVVRGYIDWMVQVPWNARSKVKKDLRQAQEILDTDPVSYTHLDVYKRQAYFTRIKPDAANQKRGCQAHSECVAQLIPVSYTHLTRAIVKLFFHALPDTIDVLGFFG